MKDLKVNNKFINNRITFIKQTRKISLSTEGEAQSKSNEN
jgi:hypothetical protein